MHCKSTTQNQCEWRHFTKATTSTTLWPLTRSTSNGTRRDVLSLPSWTSSIATRSIARSRLKPLKWKLDFLSLHGPRTSVTRRFWNWTLLVHIKAKPILNGYPIIISRWKTFPGGAHHRLGILERNHTVRRKILETFKAELPDCKFETGLLVTAPAQQAELSQGSYACPELPLWLLAIYLPRMVL